MNHMRMVLGEKDSIPIKSTMLAATYQVRPLPLTRVLSKPVQYVHLSLSNPVVYQRLNREYMLLFFITMTILLHVIGIYIFIYSVIVS